MNISDAVVNITTRELVKAGLSKDSGIQKVDGITIYPAVYLNPLDDATGRLHVTDDTHSIHWFSKTWMNVPPWRQHLSRFAHRLLGVNTISRLRKFICK